MKILSTILLIFVFNCSFSQALFETKVVRYDTTIGILIYVNKAGTNVTKKDVLDIWEVNGQIKDSTWVEEFDGGNLVYYYKGKSEIRQRIKIVLADKTVFDFINYKGWKFIPNKSLPPK